jgi:hypothetical protein
MVSEQPGLGLITRTSPPARPRSSFELVQIGGEVRHSTDRVVDTEMGGVRKAKGGAGALDGAMASTFSIGETGGKAFGLDL